ncbi:MAG: alpha-amylase family glycosyl hydrolase, partial [Spirochaeta sp.]
RHVSRYGNDSEYWAESAKLWALVLHGLRGTPYVYQGEEIGMINYPFTSIEEFRDIEAKNAYKAMREEYGMSEEEALRRLNAHSRDHARTPVQWQENMEEIFPHPWIPINPNVSRINVQNQLDDPNSIWELYRRVIDYRKELPVLSGDWTGIAEDHDNVFAYIRSTNDQLLLVLANPGDTPVQLDLDLGELPVGWQDIAARVNPRLILSSVHDLRELPRAVHLDPDRIQLQPWEASYLLWDRR